MATPNLYCHLRYIDSMKWFKESLPLATPPFAAFEQKWVLKIKPNKPRGLRLALKIFQVILGLQVSAHSKIMCY